MAGSVLKALDQVDHARYKLECTKAEKFEDLSMKDAYHLAQVKDIFGCSGLKGHASIIKNKESYKSVEDYYFGLNHALYYGEETSNINGAISLIS